MPKDVLNVYCVVDYPQDEEHIAIFRSNLREAISVYYLQRPVQDTRFYLLTCGKAPKLYLLEYGTSIPALAGEKKFYIGDALRLLSETLLKNDVTSKYCPIIIFMSSRFPYDDFIDELYRLKHSKFYDEAVTIGFAFGDLSYPLMKLLCKHEEAIIGTSDLSSFGRLFNVKEKIREEQIPVKVDPPGHGEDVTLGILPPDEDILGDDAGW